MAALFLDLDGTLTDPKPGITGAVIHTLTQLGIVAPSADALEWVIGPPLLDSFFRLGVPDPHMALAIYRRRYAAQGLMDAGVYDGIPEALDVLHKSGHRLFLATAKPHVFATQITAHFGLDTHLAAQFGPELDGARQDKADLLRFALEQLDIPTSQAIMIGDRDNDLNAAAANDMRFVGVQWGYGAPGELDQADTLCAKPPDLPGAVARIIV